MPEINNHNRKVLLAAARLTIASLKRRSPIYLLIGAAFIIVPFINICHEFGPGGRLQSEIQQIDCSTDETTTEDANETFQADSVQSILSQSRTIGSGNWNNRSSSNRITMEKYFKLESKPMHVYEHFFVKSNLCQLLSLNPINGVNLFPTVSIRYGWTISEGVGHRRTSVDMNIYDITSIEKNSYAAAAGDADIGFTITATARSTTSTTAAEDDQNEITLTCRSIMCNCNHDLSQLLYKYQTETYDFDLLIASETSEPASTSSASPTNSNSLNFFVRLKADLSTRTKPIFTNLFIMIFGYSITRFLWFRHMAKIEAQIRNLNYMIQEMARAAAGVVEAEVET